MRSQHRPARNRLREGQHILSDETREMALADSAGVNTVLRYKFGPPRSVASWGNQCKDYRKARVTLAKVWQEEGKRRAEK